MQGVVSSAGTRPSGSQRVSRDSVTKSVPSVQLLGRLVLSKKDLSKAQPSDVEGTATVRLQLVSVELDPNGEPKVSDKVEKSDLKIDGTRSPDSLEIKAGEEEYFVVFEVPEDFGEVGAFKIWSEYEKQLFIHSFVLTLPNQSTIAFRCQSWVYNEENYELERFFFSNKVYLPEDTPQGLKELREWELQVLRGEGPGRKKQERKPVDRIYDYDIYNDLGDADNKNIGRRPLLGGSEDLPFPRRVRTGRPRSKNENTEGWRTDDEYGRQALAGLNPQVIRRVKEFPPAGSSMKAADIKQLFNDKDVDKMLNVLFTIDHTKEFLPYIEKINMRQPVKAYAPRSLFYWDSKSRKMVPIAIELSLSERGKVTSRVFTPPHARGTTDHGWEKAKRDWEIAKIHASSIDFSYHEVYSHFVRTHACVEPFVIASNRHLSRLHPIYNFVLPLFKNTLNINSAARQILINGLGYIESVFTPGVYSMEIGSKLYGKYWRFDKESLPVDLIERGFAEKSDGDPGGVKFIIDNPDYPYAEDGLEIWDALKTYTLEYVHIAYSDDHAVVNDSELQSWWTEIKEVGHGDKKEGWSELKSRADLVDILTTLAWVAGPQHAAVNFGQYAYGAFPPNRTTLTRAFIPGVRSQEYTEMQKVSDKNHSDKNLLRTIANYPASVLTMDILMKLSAHDLDEEYLGQRHDEHWNSDPQVETAFQKLNDTLRDIEQKQQKRNNDPTRFNRRGAVQVPYTLLYPSSPSPGVTGMGIPNSISI